MIFQKEANGYIWVTCDKCGKSHTKHKAYYKQYGDEYHFNPPITCSCGKTNRIAVKDTSTNKLSPQIRDEELIKCPKCGSTQLSAGNSGFGLGKAAAGGLLLGPIGLLGGFIGSNKVIVTCLNCGKQWKAGQG